MSQISEIKEMYKSISSRFREKQTKSLQNVAVISAFLRPDSVRCLGDISHEIALCDLVTNSLLTPCLVYTRERDQLTICQKISRHDGFSCNKPHVYPIPCTDPQKYSRIHLRLRFSYLKHT